MIWQRAVDNALPSHGQTSAFAIKLAGNRSTAVSPYAGAVLCVQLHAQLGQQRAMFAGIEAVEGP